MPEVLDSRAKEISLERERGNMILEEEEELALLSDRNFSMFGWKTPSLTLSSCIGSSSSHSYHVVFLAL